MAHCSSPPHSRTVFTDVYTWGEASQTGHKNMIDDKNNKVKIPLVVSRQDTPFFHSDFHRLVHTA